MLPTTSRIPALAARAIAAIALVPQVLLAQTERPGCALSAEEIFAEVSPSVVQVFSISINPFLVVGRVSPRGGTGFVIEGGYIVTNYHVVADAPDVVVQMGDRFFDAAVIGIDPALDVAVLEPWTEDLAGGGVAFARPEELTIGQPAYAVGYPLGLGQSISAGLVSGVSRVLPRTTSSWLSPFIQTDAAISPGNSGGPLVDECGRVIGMITSAMNDPSAENIGFAIPLEVLSPVIDALRDQGYVSRPWHGLYGQMTSPLVLQILGYPPDEWERVTGFMVETVEPGSAGARAGLVGGSWPMMWGGLEILLGGDIITHVGKVRIDSLDTALGVVRSIEVGDEVRLTYLRDGVERTTRVVVAERPIIAQELEVYRHRQP